MLVSVIIAFAIIALTIAGLIAEAIGWLIARRRPSAPLYQDPQRAETDAWANAYPEPKENHS